VVNHIGFNARNSAESVAKWQAAGIKPEPGNQPGQFYITTSDGVRIEILEDKSIGPGANLTYGENDKKQATTKGRALDHIGFEVANLDFYATKLQAQGVDFDVAPRIAPNGTTKVAFLTDPWGTYIELTQGLAPAK
jgi:glyoxalase/bleomycin resistance protein/dioxygenase superfamily protein